MSADCRDDVVFAQDGEEEQRCATALVTTRNSVL